MRQYLERFFTRCSYPDEAAKSLLCDFDRICENGEAKKVFDECIALYEDSTDIDYNGAHKRCGDAAESAGVHRYAGELLIYCCWTRRLKERYEEKGLPQKVWLDSVIDLRAKAVECYKMYGVWGSFVCFWFPGFFKLTRFACGRLQYEFCRHYATGEPYTKHGVCLVKQETPVVGMHIPSLGPLRHEEVSESYRLAFDFFGKYYPEYLYNGCLVAECYSWLLYEGLEDILSPASNILRFKHDFDIVYSGADRGFEDCWRLFNKSWDGDASSLPRDTDMRRRYADHLAKGGTAGVGTGILIFDGEKVLTERA